MSDIHFDPKPITAVDTLRRYSNPTGKRPPYTKEQALAGEINKLWGIPIPRLMTEIKRKGYQFIQETYTQVQKNPNARNPAALFLWTIKNCKVELKEV